MADDDPRGVVVGVDGSDPARRALDWAMTEAQLRDLPLYVVSAQPSTPGYVVLAPGPHFQEDLEHVLAELRAGTEAMVTQVNAERERPLTGPIVVHVYAGTATEVLLGLSERHELIVVGSRGSGGFSRLLLGSVSTAIVHHAGCPVLVVRS